MRAVLRHARLQYQRVREAVATLIQPLRFASNSVWPSPIAGEREKSHKWIDLWQVGPSTELSSGGAIDSSAAIPRASIAGQNSRGLRSSWLEDPYRIKWKGHWFSRTKLKSWQIIHFSHVVCVAIKSADAIAVTWTIIWQAIRSVILFYSYS